MTPENDRIWTELVSGDAVSPEAEARLAQEIHLAPKLAARLATDRWIDRALASMPPIDAGAEAFHERVVTSLAIDHDEQHFVEAISERIDHDDRLRFRTSQRRGALGALTLGAASACALVIFATLGTHSIDTTAPRPAPLAAKKQTPTASRSTLTAGAPFDSWRAGGWVAMPAGAQIEAGSDAAWHLRSQRVPLALSTPGGPVMLLNANTEVEISAKGGQAEPLAVNIISGAVFVDTAGAGRSVSVRAGGEAIKPIGRATSAFVAQKGEGLSVAVLRGAVASLTNKRHAFGSGIAATLDGNKSPQIRPTYRGADFGWTPAGQDRRQTVMNFDFEDGKTPPFWNTIPVPRCPPHPGQDGRFCVTGRHYANAPWIVGLEMKNMNEGFFTLEPGMTLSFDYWTGQAAGDREQAVQIWIESEPGAGFRYDLWGVGSARWVRAEVPFADFQARVPEQPLQRLRPGDRVRFISIMVMWHAEDVLFIDNVEITRRASPAGI